MSSMLSHQGISRCRGDDTMTVLSVAVVQCAAHHLDPAANAEMTVDRIDQAVAAGAGLVVLPELVSTSYDPAHPGLVDCAESVDDMGPCLQAWTASARRHGVAIIAGFAERRGSKLFNSAAVIDPTGTVIEVYRKLHLFGAEQGIFTPGDRGLPTVDILGARIGVLVCYDLRFPETVRIHALRGVELIAVPTAWTGGFDRSTPPEGRIGQVDGALVQSNLNQVFMACADQVGGTANHTFLGRSIVTDPYGQAVIGPLSPTEEDLAVVTLDLEDVSRARHRGAGIDPMENRRTDVYAADLGYRTPTDPEPLGG